MPRIRSGRHPHQVEVFLVRDQQGELVAPTVGHLRHGAEADRAVGLVEGPGWEEAAAEDLVRAPRESEVLDQAERDAIAVVFGAERDVEHDRERIDARRTMTRPTMGTAAATIQEHRRRRRLFVLRRDPRPGIRWRAPTAGTGSEA